MVTLSREIVFLILQFLEEDMKLDETARRLEQESKIYFNYEYFEGEILRGNWNQTKEYLSSFTKIRDNDYSSKIIYKKCECETLEDLERQYAAFIDYQDPVAKRRSLLVQLRELFDENLIFQDKMWFPNMEKSRLRNLTDKSLKGPHHLCKSPNPNMPDIKTPNVDHSCQQLDDHANNELEPILPAPAPRTATSTANSDMLWCLPVAGPPNSND